MVMVKKTSKSKKTAEPESIVHLLHRASQYAEEMFAKFMDSNTLTSRQFTVLKTIRDLNKPSQTVICDATGIDRSTLADIVRRLSSRHLVARRRTREDNRRYALWLTNEGQQALEKALPIIESVDREFMALLEPQQSETLRTLLRQLTIAASTKTETETARKPIL
jgi:DNA-binding MarR family transcriptional regulator